MLANYRKSFCSTAQHWGGGRREERGAADAQPAGWAGAAAAPRRCWGMGGGPCSPRLYLSHTQLCTQLSCVGKMGVPKSERELRVGEEGLGIRASSLEQRG